MDNKGKRSGITDDHDASTGRYSAFIADGLMMIMIMIFWDNVQSFWMPGKYFTGNTLEGDVIALDQLTSPFSPRKATKMSP